MVLEPNAIIALYGYSAEEQELFPYIATYMRIIEDDLTGIVTHAHTRARFALAGLFLTYRTCNHQGVNMSTRDSTLQLPAIHAERLRHAREIIGQDIMTSADYRKLMKLSMWSLFLPGLGTRLGRFVRQGN